MTLQSYLFRLLTLCVAFLGSSGCQSRPWATQHTSRPSAPPQQEASKAATRPPPQKLKEQRAPVRTSPHLLFAPFQGPAETELHSGERISGTNDSREEKLASTSSQRAIRVVQSRRGVVTSVEKQATLVGV
ncbi:MAG: hypothetical protein MK135_14045, partial [Polyangiaceae bacterium]|nr:hypothetical protein [Polyangiaceae bacterium]